MSKRELASTGSQAKKIKLDDENLKPSHTLYIKNLNDQIKPATLKHWLYLLFSTYGDIIDIQNKHRGQAHVLFASVDTATMAKKRENSKLFFGKPLVIYFSRKESKLITELENKAEGEQ